MSSGPREPSNKSLNGSPTETNAAIVNTSPSSWKTPTKETEAGIDKLGATGENVFSRELKELQERHQRCQTRVGKLEARVAALEKAVGDSKRVVYVCT